MDRCGIKTLKMMYKDHLECIKCPKNAKYEECIQIALKRFEIPAKLKDYVQITNERSEIFDKSTFEYYNILFPSPALIFFIKINNEELNEPRFKHERRAFGKLNNKRKLFAECFGVPVTKQNCFLGSLPGYDTPQIEEPRNKRFKSTTNEIPAELGALTRTISRRTIRL